MRYIHFSKLTSQWYQSVSLDPHFGSNFSQNPMLNPFPGLNVLKSHTGEEEHGWIDCKHTAHSQLTVLTNWKIFDKSAHSRIKTIEAQDNTRWSREYKAPKSNYKILCTNQSVKLVLIQSAPMFRMVFDSGNIS